MNRKITEKQRIELKKPLGKIVKVEDTKTDSKFITIGDETSCLFLEKNKIPYIIIYDRKIKRRQAVPEKIKIITALKINEIKAKNPPGTITEEAENAVKQALSLNEKTKIYIDGEEDLLVIPAIMLAPIDTLVYYGQPDEGIVQLKVTQQLKNKMKKIVEQMEVIK